MGAGSYITKKGGKSSQIFSDIPKRRYHTRFAEYYYDYARRAYVRTQQAAPQLSVGGSDACGGDSGGALVVWKDIKNKGVVEQRAFLIGLVSRGEGCAHKDIPGIYTR